MTNIMIGFALWVHEMSQKNLYPLYASVFCVKRTVVGVLVLGVSATAVLW